MTRKSTAPMDRGWAWVVVFGVFVNSFFMMGITKASGIFLVEFMDRFHVGTAYAGATMTAVTMVFALGSPITGVLGERVTHRKVMIFGGIVGMFGLSMCSLLVNMPYVIVFFALGLGIGNSCAYGSGMVMIGKYFHKKRSTATGIALSGTSVGQFALPPIIEYFLESYGLGGTLLIIGALYLHCSFAGALLRPVDHGGTENKSQEMLQNDVEKDSLDRTTLGQNLDDDLYDTEILITKDSKESEEKSSIHSLNGIVKSERTEESVGLTRNFLKDSKSVLPITTENKVDVLSADEVGHNSKRKRRNLTSLLKIFIDFSILHNYVIVLFVCESFCAFFTFFSFTILTPAIAVDRGMTKYHKAMLVSLSGIGDLIARLSVGCLADRNYIKRYKIKFMTAILCAFNCVALIFADSFAWMGVHCFIFGLSSGTYICLMPLVVLDFLSLSVLSNSLGMVNFAQGFGGSLGQALLAFVRDVTGSYTPVLLIQATFIMLSAILLICTPLVSRLDKTKNEKVRTYQK